MIPFRTQFETIRDLFVILCPVLPMLNARKWSRNALNCVFAAIMVQWARKYQ